MRLSALFSIATASLLFVSCDKEGDTAPAVIKPSNLQVNLDVPSNGEGQVNVELSATNANFFEVTFDDPAGEVNVQAEGGVASHRFSESGTHAVISRALATYEHYIERIDSVTVTVPEKDPVTGIPDSGYTSPMSYPGYTLVWQDEFEGNSLSSDWTYEIGTGNNGWGNNELQYYRQENAEVKDGYLTITAKREAFGGRQYTSSRIITENAQSFQYGRIDIRAALPQGKGIWPALWMLGEDFRSVGWPSCGEIDIMEMVGGPSSSAGGDDRVFGTVHWSNNGQHAEYGGSNRLSEGKFADEFHVFSIVWDANQIVWYRDDIRFHSIDIRPADLDEFRDKFFFIFNVAVGGNWPGSPNSATQFPQTMAVDYVRVFQR